VKMISLIKDFQFMIPTIKMNNHISHQAFLKI